MESILSVAAMLLRWLRAMLHRLHRRPIDASAAATERHFVSGVPIGPDEDPDDMFEARFAPADLGLPDDLIFSVFDPMSRWLRYVRLGHVDAKERMQADYRAHLAFVGCSESEAAMLVALVSAGDETALDTAARRLTRAGPPAPLVDAAAAIREEILHRGVVPDDSVVEAFVRKQTWNQFGLFDALDYLVGSESVDVESMRAAADRMSLTQGTVSNA
jgi:hypothetical protein